MIAPSASGRFNVLEMPQWLLGIFAAYLVVAIAVVIARAFKPKNATCSVVDNNAFGERFFFVRSVSLSQ